MNKIRRSFLLMLSPLIFFCCGYKQNKETSSGGKPIEKHLSQEDVFLREIYTNRREMSDSVRIERLLDSNFFKQASSLAFDYVLLFNHIVNHDNEEYDEAISQFLYEMFSNYPDKFMEFDTYLNKMPKNEQNKILSSVSLSISFAFLSESSDSAFSEVAFIKKFPYIEKKGCLKYYRQAIENY